MFKKKWMNEKSIEELKKTRKTLVITGFVYMVFGAAYIFLGCYAHYFMGLGVTGIISIVIGALAVILGESFMNSCEKISILIYLKTKNKEDDRFV